jgi:hypothetical protein
MTKIKNKKKVISKSNKKGTLDQKHTEYLARFEKQGKMLPMKKEKLARLEDELESLSEIGSNKDTTDIRRKAQLLDSIQKLRMEIYSIENCTDSLNYIVKILPILVDYYDNDNIAEDGMDEIFVNDMNESNGKKNILSYFMKETTTTTNKSVESPKKKVLKKKSTGKKSSVKINENNKSSDKKSNEELSETSDSKPKKAPISRAKLYDNFLKITEVNHRKLTKTKLNHCSVPKCDGELILSQNDGCMVCKVCGVSEPILIQTDKPNYKEPTQDSGTYAYKRINHLTEILSQLQAKESTDIPSKVFESVLRELKKRKINKDELDIFRLRRILKKLNLRKYYEHVPHILQIINGKEPPNFSRQDEIKIKKMFKDIQKPFTIYCPKDRKNFLNYSYVLHKFCELLALDDYTGYFPLLKNHAKLLQHDKIWKNICKYMKWKYYKSI